MVFEKIMAGLIFTISWSWYGRAMQYPDQSVLAEVAWRYVSDLRTHNPEAHQNLERGLAMYQTAGCKGKVSANTIVQDLETFGQWAAHTRVVVEREWTRSGAGSIPVLLVRGMVLYNAHDTAVPMYVTNVAQIAHKYCYGSLDVCCNDICSIEPCVFEQMAQQFPDMHGLWLCGNALCQLPETVSALSEVYTLALSYNQLRELPLSALQKLSKLGVIHLDGNPLVTESTWPAVRARLIADHPSMLITPE